MLTVLALLLTSVATFRLADSVIDGNTMTTWMPANKVVYVAIQGSGTVEVQAKGADIGTKIKCQSPKEGMYCLLWTPDHNAFGLTKSASGESVHLVLEAVADQSSTVKFHVMSDDRLTFDSGSNKVQLNGIREVKASVSLQEFAGKGAFLKLSSEDPSTADYFNRLTLQLSGDKGKQSTDASGRNAHLFVQTDGQTTVDLKLVAEAGQTIQFHSMADEHPIAMAHMADLRRPRWSVNSGKFASIKLAHESMFLRRYNQVPIENTIPNRDTWHWLHDGAKTFKVMEDEVQLKNVVGRGHFGTVHNAYDKHFKVDVVAKLIKKSRQFINEDVEFQVNNEVEVLNKLPVHPNVCRFYRAFETLNFVVLLLENCGSESMFKRYARRSATESEVRYFLRQIVAGQQALQRAGVYQIDIKLTNMMVTSEGVLKLIDFGLARLTDEEQLNIVGADGYYCPEMIFMQPYRPSMVDTWNDGICIYKMLYGNYCFGSQYDDFYKENLKELDYTFPPFPAISHDMKRLFSRLFQFEKKRYTLDELANDPWLTTHSN